MSPYKVLLSMAMAVATAGCVPALEIRTDFSSAVRSTVSRQSPLPEPAPVQADCSSGKSVPGENRRVIEDYGSYVLGFAEFDDQGWSFDNDHQLVAIQDRLRAELTDTAYSEMDFVVVVFVHGWHHNAHDNDCNVAEAGQMLRITSEQFDAAIKAGKFHRKRRVFGIYVGWRGESVDAPVLRYTTVIDRLDIAEKVAKGSVRQLFAREARMPVSARLRRYAHRLARLFRLRRLNGGSRRLRQTCGAFAYQWSPVGRSLELMVWRPSSSGNIGSSI